MCTYGFIIFTNIQNSSILLRIFVELTDKSMHMNYYLLVGGLQKGPFSLDELWQNGISKDTLVWHAGMAGWQKASELEELKELLEQLPPTSSRYFYRLACCAS